MLMPINLPPRDFILRILLWTTTSLNEQDTIVLFNDTISIIEEPRIVDTELLGLYVILLACFTAAAYGALTFAQGKGWVKKPRKSKTAPGKISIILLIFFSLVISHLLLLDNSNNFHSPLINILLF